MCQTATFRRKRAFRGVRLKEISGSLSERRENPTTGDRQQLAIFSPLAFKPLANLDLSLKGEFFYLNRP
jgi:hypothetical protein